MRANDSLCRHTALRTGGRCTAFAVVHHADALGPYLGQLKAASQKWALLGAGTRDVARDGEVHKVVVRLGTGFCRMSVDGAQVEVGAALPCPALAWGAAAQGLAGIDDLVRSPGSLGAALSLDEGPWRERVTEIALWRRGGVRWVPPAEALGHKLILGARLTLEPSSIEQATQALTAALTGARALPSWYLPLKRGSVEVELRRVDAAGVRLRGVLIPASSPEMVVNVGLGPARDLKMLHRSALKRVHQLRGVELTSAVRWSGRAS
ncbi:MAG: hypothetical protein AB8H79_03430 [Myxococcota bacterium]